MMGPISVRRAMPAIRRGATDVQVFVRGQLRLSASQCDMATSACFWCHGPMQAVALPACMYPVLHTISYCMALPCILSCHIPLYSISFHRQYPTLIPTPLVSSHITSSHGNSSCPALLYIASDYLVSCAMLCSAVNVLLILRGDALNRES